MATSAAARFVGSNGLLSRLLSPPSPRSPSLAAYSRLFASSSVASQDEKPEIPGRMPAVPEKRPKPTTAVAVVEQYTEKLWRDFFTNPTNWFDNRRRKIAPKYADFKHRFTKEGLWINTKWNPPWVRVELSLMTHFKPIPLDKPLETEQKAEGEVSEKESTRVSGEKVAGQGQ